MTNETWMQQKARLIDRFGERNFSKEFSLLVAIECKPMPDFAFVDMVNAMIGSRRPNDPPLIADFRNARLAFEKRILDAQTNQFAKVMSETPRQQGLRLYLAKEFPGCKTAWEAVEVRRHQIRIAKADDPSYEPMCDKKWIGEHAWPEGPDDGGPAGAA